MLWGWATADAPQAQNPFSSTMFKREPGANVVSRVLRRQHIYSKGRQ